MKKLLNRYQSRALQFALELTAELERAGTAEAAALQEMARKDGLDYAGQVLEPLYRAGFLEHCGRGCRLAEGMLAPYLPMSAMELDYLAWILNLPEASLFLDAKVLEALRSACGTTDFFQPVQFYAPPGEPLPARPGPEGFHTLLEAVRQRRLIQYDYFIQGDLTPHVGITMPWKLEYSAYDRRWWVILYDREADRTIKARLNNLEHIQLLGPAGVSEETIRQAMDRLLEPEPVVLRVRKEKGALERCFLVFEGQLFQETRQLSPSSFYLSFRIYRFDRGDILRRLLYLGPAVTLLEPASMRKDLAELLDRALLS